MIKIVLPVVVTLGLLAGLQVQKMSYLTADDAVDYHARVKAAVDAIPYEVGPWKGQDVPVPHAARALLKPNALLSRTYVNGTTGQQMNLLIVQVRIARHMIGHYPPNCYPGSGWTKRAADEVSWNVPTLNVPGVLYEFYQAFPTRSATIFVANVLILPDGSMVRSMDAVSTLAADYRKHFFGAAQVQMTFGSDVPADQRDTIIRTFIEANVPVFEKIRSGVES